MKPHIFHPEADEEYVGAVQFYADASLELAARFHHEIERLIAEIRKTRNASANLTRQPADIPATIFLTQLFSWINRSIFGLLP